MHSSGMHTTHSSNRLLGGVCLIACWDTPTTRAWNPHPGCGPEDPRGVGLETLEQSRNTILVMSTQVHYLSHRTVQYGTHLPIRTVATVPVRTDQPVE